MVVPDSICYPRARQQPVPVQSRRQPGVPGGQALPRAVLAHPGARRGHHAAAVRHVRLKLPVRHPVLVAKQATSTAVLTGNRLVLGVGTSPWREDYEVLGVPWADRGRRMDEELASSAGWRPAATSSTTGEIFDLPPVKIAPVPSEPIPILIGGHGDAALRRAARRGDGWLHGGGDPAQLPGLLARLAEFRRQAGTAGPAVRGARDLHGRLQRGRGAAAGGAGGDRRDRRLPLAVRDRPGPRAAGRQARPKLRRFADGVIAPSRT